MEMDHSSYFQNSKQLKWKKIQATLLTLLLAVQKMPKVKKESSVLRYGSSELGFSSSAT